MLKKIFIIFFIFNIFTINVINIFANDTEENSQNNESLEIAAKAAILIDQNSGEVLFEYNANERLSPASITKLMTLFIIYESINEGKISFEDEVTISEHAASMGGSQIFLAANEVQTVRDLTKSIAIASANDAAVAMAEYIAGSEEEFVKLMNEKAKELGLTNTNFENACGLDEDTTNHYMSARDIAILSRNIMLKYPEIQEFTTKWQDTIVHKTSKGEEEFGLTNTNKLLKWYDGTTGLKTGSTQKALYCVSATATKDDLSLIAVVMGASDAKTRFLEAVKMFEYGFSNYESVEIEKEGVKKASVLVYKGDSDFVDAVTSESVNIVLKKGEDKNITSEIEVLENVKAPIDAGTKLGEVIYKNNGEEIARVNLVATQNVAKANFGDMIKKLLIKWIE